MSGRSFAEAVTNALSAERAGRSRRGVRPARSFAVVHPAAEQPRGRAAGTPTPLTTTDPLVDAKEPVGWDSLNGTAEDAGFLVVMGSFAAVYAVHRPSHEIAVARPPRRCSGGVNDHSKGGCADCERCSCDPTVIEAVHLNDGATDPRDRLGAGSAKQTARPHRFRPTRASDHPSPRHRPTRRRLRRPLRRPLRGARCSPPWTGRRRRSGGVVSRCGCVVEPRVV